MLHKFRSSSFPLITLWSGNDTAPSRRGWRCNTIQHRSHLDGKTIGKIISVIRRPGTRDYTHLFRQAHYSSGPECQFDARSKSDVVSCRVRVPAPGRHVKIINPAVLLRRAVSVCYKRAPFPAPFSCAVWCPGPGAREWHKNALYIQPSEPTSRVLVFSCPSR